MNKVEIGKMLISGAEEIRRLRNTNQSQGEKLEIFYGMLRLSQLVEARGSQGMSPDLAWDMSKKGNAMIEEFERENVPSKNP